MNARKLKEYFRKNGAKKVKKEYVALVDGEFPAGPVTCDDAFKGHLVNQEGYFKQYAAPKESITHFERLSYDGQFSLVKCVPITGRTHQIR